MITPQKKPRRKPPVPPEPRLPGPTPRSRGGWAVAGMAVVFLGSVATLGLGLVGIALGLYVHDASLTEVSGGLAGGACVLMWLAARWLRRY